MKNKIIFVLVCAVSVLFSACAGNLNENSEYSSTYNTVNPKYTMDIVAVKCDYPEVYYGTIFYVLDATDADSFYLYSGNITSKGTIDATANTTVSRGSYSSGNFPLCFSKDNETEYEWSDCIKEPSSTTGYIGVFDKKYTSKIYGYDDISTLQVKLDSNSKAFIFESYSYTGTAPDGFYYSQNSEQTYDSSYASYFTKVTEGSALGTSFDNYLYAKYGDYYVRCFN